MHGLLLDLRYALRMMHRTPGLTAVAVLALGLGIGANTAVFTVLNGVLLRPLPYPDADRLLVLSNAPDSGPFGPMVGMIEADYLALRSTGRSFEDPATFAATEATLTGAGEPVRLPAALVTPDYFALLRVPPAGGRAFRAQDAGSPVVLLGDAIWRGRFQADPQILGKKIKLDGVPHTVIGVMPPRLGFSNAAQLWIPLDVQVNSHRVAFRPVVTRLKPGQTIEQARAEFTAFVKSNASGQAQSGPPLVARVLPLKTLLVGDVGRGLGILAGAVAFVLLIACANMANLLLMRGEARRQEIDVRIALGAGRKRLVRQLLTESLLVSLFGGAIGILLALWGVPALLALAPPGSIPRSGEISIDAPVLGFTLAVSLLTGLLFGTAPAIQATRRSLRDSLTRSARITSRGGLRNILAVAEIALALVLLSGAGLMLKSLWKVHAVDPGFRAGSVVAMTVSLPEAVYREPAAIKAFHSSVLERLASVNGVSASAAVNSLPLAGSLTKGDFQMQDAKFPRHFAVEKLVVSPNYFHAMGIQLKSGRDFSPRDTATAPHVAMISAAAAGALWPGMNPLGKRISENDHPKPEDWYTIVGVVDDVRQEALTKRPDAAVYFPVLQSPHDGWLPHMTFVVRTAAPLPQIASSMRAALHEVDAELPVEHMSSMQDLISISGAPRAFQARLLVTFALLALALAAIGVYGVLSYSVATRTHEIGIRMALGAQPAAMLGMVVRRTALLAGAGLALGTAASLLVTRVLEKLLFEVTPNDPATMLAVALVLGIAALAAGWIPARRAARVDPLVALRWE